MRDGREREREVCVCVRERGVCVCVSYHSTCKWAGNWWAQVSTSTTPAHESKVYISILFIHANKYSDGPYNRLVGPLWWGLTGLRWGPHRINLALGFIPSLWPKQWHKAKKRQDGNPPPIANISRKSKESKRKNQPEMGWGEWWGWGGVGRGGTTSH